MGSNSGIFLESVKGNYRLPRVILTAVEDRVAPLPQALQRTAKRGLRNNKHVHRLRVTARRAEATLTLFADHLPEKAVNKILKRMRHIRRIAGELRNLDVLIARFEGQDSTKLRKLLHDLKTERIELQPKLVAAAAELENSSWSRQLDLLRETVANKKAKKTPLFTNFAHDQIEEQAEDFLRLCLRDLARIDALHELRIAGKKLRYVIELTINAFPQDMRTKVYPKFVQVQERLGEVNDYATAIAFLEQWSHSHSRKGIAALIAQDTIRMHRAAQQFREWFHKNRRKRLGKLFKEVLD